MNNFYASVELLSRPDLRGRAVIVGGDVAKRRGVVLARNERAKASDVRTGEPLVDALRKCPNAVVLPPQHARYAEYSQRAMAIYRDVSPRLQSFGLDECWIGLDVGLDEGVKVGNALRATIRGTLGLSISVGVSWTRVFAKLGSDYRKPDALTLISRANYRELIWPLPASRLLFVGPTLAQRLERLGIHSIGQIAAADEAMMLQLFGRSGPELVRSARGDDADQIPLESEQEPARSVGAMQTTPHDLTGLEDCLPLLAELAAEVAERLQEQEVAGHTLRLYFKTSDFRNMTRQRRLPQAIDEAEAIFGEALRLFAEQDELLDTPLRLIGITMAGLEARGRGEQLSFADLMAAHDGEGSDTDEDVAGPELEAQQTCAPAIERLLTQFEGSGLMRARDLVEDEGAKTGDVPDLAR